MRLALASVAVLLLAGCPHPNPAPNAPHPDVIQCGTQAVQTCAPQTLPAVNECLSGTGDVTACLLGLVKPGGCLAYEVIACLVKHEGSAANAAWQANAGDLRDQLRAARAKEFLEGQHVTFADGP